ncbi:MAG TPA: Maf family protein [Planctomycetota bacterium]|nr:Maf family protein [Planctomycetota bacterium]
MSASSRSWRSPLILASSSPQRRALLSDLGEPFEVVPADVDETPPPGALAAAVRAIARRKADAVARRVARGLVLGADTVIDRGGDLLGKPASADEAREMLRSLSGRSHRVHTGVALVGAGGAPAREGVATTVVHFREVAPAEIDAYVASGEPFGKAGAYAIQGGAAGFVVRVDGDVDNVVGLPLRLVRRLLAELDAGA